MSGTHLFYNGVLMRGCTLMQYSTDIEYDESDTDVLYSKTTISVESLLVGLVPFYTNQPPTQAGGFDAPWNSMAVPYVDHETVVDRWMEVQERLQENRKDFWMAINGATAQRQPGRVEIDGKESPPIPANDGYFNDSYRVVLAATGLSQEDLDKTSKAPDGMQADLGFIEAFSDKGDGKSKTKIVRAEVIDLNNGPKTRNVRVDIIGGRALRVNFTVEVCRCFCRPTQTSSAPPVKDSAKMRGVISNRWSLTESTDHQQKTTHQIDGKLIVSDARYKPAAMKLLVQPALFPYAKLQSRNFTTDRTGLVLSYQLEIAEVGPAAPKGITSWTGTYGERSSLGGKKLADLSIKVTGTAWPSNAPANSTDPDKEHKTYLLAMAYRIAQARVKNLFKPFGPDLTRTHTITDLYVVEHMAEPTIELRLSIIYNDGATDAFGLRLKNMGASLKATIPGYGSKWWPVVPAVSWDVASEKKASTDLGWGSYFDCYFQTPCSEWHSTPRGATSTEVITRPDAPANNSTSNGPSDVYATGMDVPVDPALTANLNDPNDPVPGREVPSETLGWHPDQVDFAYIQADIDTRYALRPGKIQIPLSKERRVSRGSAVGETSVVVSLHAGLAQRTITMVASRMGKWPKVPAPVSVATTGTIVEKFLEGEAVNDVPKLAKDGVTMIYSTQIRWVYALSRIPQAPLGDSFRAASSPMDRTTPATNSIKLTDYFATNGDID